MSLPEKPGFYSSSEAELRCTGWVSSKWAFNFIHLNLCFPTGQLNFIHSITHSNFYRFTFFPRANPNFIYHYNNYNHSFRESCVIQLVSLKSLSNIPKIFHGGYYHPFTQQFLISEFLVLSNRWVLEPICPKSLISIPLAPYKDQKVHQRWILQAFLSNPSLSIGHLIFLHNRTIPAIFSQGVAYSLIQNTIHQHYHLWFFPGSTYTVLFVQGVNSIFVQATPS